MIFDPSAAEGIEAGYELWIGEARSRAEVAEGRCEIVRGAADRPEATIETTQPPWPHWSTKAAPRGDPEIVGDGSAVARFLTLFPLPEPVPPAVEAQAARPASQAPWYIFDAFWLTRTIHG